MADKLPIVNNINIKEDLHSDVTNFQNGKYFLNTYQVEECFDRKYINRW